VDKLSQYLGAQQVPFIVAFCAWWLLGAGWLLQRSIRRVTGARRQGLGPCVLGLFLAGMGAMTVAALTCMLVVRIGENPEAPTNRYWQAGAVVGLVLALPMALLILYAVFQLPPGKLLRAAWLPLVTVLVAAAVLGTPAVILARHGLRIQNNAELSITHLRQIDLAIRDYERFCDRQFPKGLESLTEEIPLKNRTIPPLLTKSAIRCPFLPPEVAVGYFYYPGPSADPNDKRSRALRACEWPHPQIDRFHAMLFANGEVRSNPDQDFQATLKLPENADFARLYQAEEANRR
jgi:hypothetical protein